jgi:prefoldin subunit 5
MNTQRRKTIKEMVIKLDDLRSQLETVKDDDLEALKSDEREGFDNMSEGLQQSERGQAIEQAADNLDAAYDALEQATDSIQECIDALEQAGE